MILPAHTRILIYAMALMQKGWCQGSMAKDKRGREIYACDHRAVSFCAYGAVRRAVDDLGLDYGDMNDAEAYLPKTPYGSGYVTWNEEPGRTRAQVLAAFKRAALASV